MLATSIATSIAGAGIGGCSFSAPPAPASDAAIPSTADAAGATGSSPLPDAQISPDAAPPTVVLSETRSDGVVPGTSVICNNPGAQTTADGTWYRVFRLSDFGIAGALRVASVTFGADQALAARGIVVSVGTYAGTVGGATLDAHAIGILASASVDVPDGDAPQTVEVPVTATIPAGSVLAVQVAAPNLRVGSGHFHLGATTAGETAPGYFSSVACSKDPPQSTVALGGTGQLVIGVAGYVVP